MHEQKTFSYTKKLVGDYNTILEKTIESLAEQGFGVLCKIDVKKTMKEKLNIDYPDYTILSVCNPVLANKAISADKQIGLFLPCNVVVYKDTQDADEVLVSTILPHALVNFFDNKVIEEVGNMAQTKLMNAIHNV